jgi:hypothetical protein
MSDYNEHLISMAGGDGERDLLGEIEARVNAAAVGPWRWDDNFGEKGDTGTALTNDVGTEIIGAYNWHCCSYRDEPTVDDDSAAFIAHARTDIPALLAMVREQRARLDAIDAQVRDLATRLLSEDITASLGVLEALADGKVRLAAVVAATDAS